MEVRLLIKGKEAALFNGFLSFLPILITGYPPVNAAGALPAGHFLAIECIVLLC